MATKYGTAGPDTLTGTASADTIWARGGNDTLKGLAGADRLYGEADNDILFGGKGNDGLDGGPGIDRASWYQDGGSRGVTVDLALGKATRGTEKDTLLGVEGLTGSTYADTLLGNESVNLLRGSSGNDVLRARGGDDTLAGDQGNDTLDGGTGHDTATWEQFATAGIKLDLATGKATRGNETDTTTGVEDAIGTTYADTLAGDGGDNRLSGLAGNDRLEGRDGADTLLGGLGADTLLGGRGLDSIDGGGGVDELGGGADADRFVLRAGDGGADFVNDFEDGTDRFALDGLTFDNIRIVGTGTADSRISVAASSEAIAVVKGIGPDQLTAADFGEGPGSTVLDDVPSYLWYHGCGPTAGGSLIGYWDQHGYEGLFDASGWSEVKLTYNVADQISSPAHNAKYDPNPDDPSLPVPPDTSIADFMHTSEGTLDMGWSYVSDMAPGLAGYADFRGADFDSTTYSAISGFGWSDLVQSIDEGHPLLFTVDSDGNGGVDHFIPVFGYEDRGADGRFYGFNTTWQEAEDVAWEEFVPTSPGEPWGVGFVTTFEPSSVALAGDEIGGQPFERRGPAVGPGLPPEDWRGKTDLPDNLLA
jgi:hypothetical protein